LSNGPEIPRAALTSKVRCVLRREFPKLLYALCGAVLAAGLLSQATFGRHATPSRRAASSRTGADEVFAQTDAAPRYPANSVDGMLLSTAVGPFTLGSGAVRIPLRPVAPATPGAGLLASRLDTLKQGRSIYLVVRDLRTELQPGVLYQVYLNLPAGAKPIKNDPHYVGSLNFFNAGDEGPEPKADFFFSYDITVVARKLRARGLLSGQTTLTVLPAAAPLTASAPKIGRIELVEQ
jgi:hypothetical protein